MKKYNVILMSAAIVLSLGASSCSIFKPGDKAESSGKGLQEWTETGEEEIKKGAEKVKKGASVAADKVRDGASIAAEKVKEGADDVISKTKENIGRLTESNSAEGLSGDWAIETVMGKKAVGETAPFIKFEPKQHRIYGNNGCNVINAEYDEDPADNIIFFSKLATTMMLCADTNITDAEISQALEAARSYTIEVGQTDQLLTFYNDKMKVVMTLMHRDFHFLDGTWAVLAIDGEKVDIPEMKLALDVEEKHMHGNTGCNVINGELETDMETANSISFSKIAMTRMACPNSGWETRMTMALEEAVTAKKLPDDQIEFLGSNGQQVMLLQRTSPIED